MWNEKLGKIDPINTPRCFVQKWLGDVDSIRCISKGINYVCRFEKEEKALYLRVSHVDLHSKKEILAAIHFQQHLFDHYAPVCQPIKSAQGEWVEMVDQQGEIFIAHVCLGVPGTEMRYGIDDLGVYFEWGKALGKFHAASALYDAKQYDYASWDKSFAEMEEYARAEGAKIQALLARLKEYYYQKVKDKHNFGLIHGDHREANVLAMGKKISFIDFDLPCHNWFMEDLIRPFFNAVIDGHRDWQKYFSPYLDGYFSVRSRESIDLESLDKQIQLKGLEIYLWMKNNWSAELAPGGGDTKAWLSRIYDKITAACG